MGVITYLFHRTERITPQRFNVFFLDVGENIHFHYRDLRIELSVGEFEELAAGFMKYAPSVLDLIREGYRDGVLPNTNAHDTIKTFWDKSRLEHPVKYNERRLSIEDNVDGFHIHFRNYKLLLDRTSFEEFARGMGQALLQLDNRLPVDPARLLELNELHPTVVARRTRGDTEEIDVLVPEAYRDKAEQTLTGLGYGRRGDKSAGVFAKADRLVRLLASAPSETPDVGPLPLPDFIERLAGKLGPDRLNELKLRLLYLFKRAEAGHIPAFRLEDVTVDPASNTPSVDLFRAPAEADPKKEYGRLSQLLTRRKLFFVKPGKIPYDAARREALRERLEQHIREAIASHPCVNRVYLLGSSTKDRSGTYRVPFVHFDWVKLASDFDLLIEIEPDQEAAIPADWERKFDWGHNGCVYSHLGDLGDGMASNYAKTYPGVRFFERMLETYLYFPSSGNRAAKDAFLTAIAARPVFERPGLIDWFEAHYPWRADRITRIKAASFNRVYDIATEAGRFALKLYIGRYSPDKNGHRLAYEMALTEALAGFGLDVPAPVRNRTGDYATEHAEGKAVLFHFVDGRYRHEPDERDAFSAGRLLARVHLYADQVRLPANTTTPRIADTLAYWLEAYRGYADAGRLPMEAGLERHLAAVRAAEAGMVHCHGDVSPRNVLFRDDGAWLIDFQNAGLGPAAMDLADGMAEFAVRGGRFDANVMTAFLTGYQSIRPLGDAEKTALDALLPAQLLAKQARLLRAGEHGYAPNTETIEALRTGLRLLESKG